MLCMTLGLHTFSNLLLQIDKKKCFNYDYHISLQGTATKFPIVLIVTR